MKIGDLLSDTTRKELKSDIQAALMKSFWEGYDRGLSDVLLLARGDEFISFERIKAYMEMVKKERL